MFPSGQLGAVDGGETSLVGDGTSGGGLEAGALDGAAQGQEGECGRGAWCGRAGLRGWGSWVAEAWLGGGAGFRAGKRAGS